MKKQIKNRERHFSFILIPDWYFQNYSKFHFLPYFTCILFVFRISATKQWRVKQVALNVMVELKSFIHFYTSCQSPAHFFENVSPCSHRNYYNLQCSPEYSYHLDLHKSYKHRRQKLSTSIRRTQENLLWIVLKFKTVSINIPLYLDRCFSRGRDKACFQNAPTILTKIASSCCVPCCRDSHFTATAALRLPLFQVWMHKVHSWDEPINC